VRHAHRRNAAAQKHNPSNPSDFELRAPSEAQPQIIARKGLGFRPTRNRQCRAPRCGVRCAYAAVCEWDHGSFKYLGTALTAQRPPAWTDYWRADRRVRQGLIALTARFNCTHRRQRPPLFVSACAAFGISDRFILLCPDFGTLGFAVAQAGGIRLSGAEFHHEHTEYLNTLFT